MVLCDVFCLCCLRPAGDYPLSCVRRRSVILLLFLLSCADLCSHAGIGEPLVPRGLFCCSIRRISEIRNVGSGILHFFVFVGVAETLDCAVRCLFLYVVGHPNCSFRNPAVLFLIPVLLIRL